MPKKVKKNDKNEKSQQTNIKVLNKGTDASRRSSRKFGSESKLS